MYFIFNIKFKTVFKIMIKNYLNYKTYFVFKLKIFILTNLNHYSINKLI